jgi:beta-N-acetylhexosaminidase
MPSTHARIPALVLLCVFLAVMPAASEKKPKEAFNQPGPVQLTKDGQKWAEKTLKKLSLEEKVGQLLMVRALAEFQNAQSPAYTELRDQIRKYHVGSVILTVRVDGPFLLRNQPYEAAAVTNQLQRDSVLPLLVAADFERGLSMRLLATPMFPHAMAFGAAGDPKLEEEFGKVVAREARAIGVQWNFFPIADVNSNPQNPILNTRSFGEDPKEVGELAAAYIRGAKQYGLLSTAKHFPGHGDTGTDSHLELARVGASLERMKTVELPPFQQAIDAGVDAVMVAHDTVPSLEPDPNTVATISHKVITDLLKDQMGFKGLVVTDAMEMKALTNVYAGLDAHQAAAKAAVDALKAGNDMVLLPSDLEGAYNGIIAAVKSGEISQQELDARVLKVLEAKASVGLDKGRIVDLEQLRNVVDAPQSLELAQQVADRAVTLVRNQGHALQLLAQEKARPRGTNQPRGPYDHIEEPENAPPGVLALVFSDDVRSESGRVFERELRARIPDAQVMYIDPRFAPSMMEAVTSAVLNARAVIVAAYVVPSAGKMVNVKGALHNSVSLAGSVPELVDRVLKIANDKTAVVAVGNPYLALDFPQVETYVCTFSNAPTSERAAVKALLGDIPFQGKLPVSLPGYAEIGTGLSSPVAAAAGQ